MGLDPDPLVHAFFTFWSGKSVVSVSGVGSGDSIPIGIESIGDVLSFFVFIPRGVECKGDWLIKLFWRPKYWSITPPLLFSKSVLALYFCYDLILLTLSAVTSEIRWPGEIHCDWSVSLVILLVGMNTDLSSSDVLTDHSPRFMKFGLSVMMASLVRFIRQSK